MGVPDFQGIGMAVQERISATSLGRLLKALLREIDEDDMFGMAAEMAYRFLFAIFPLCLFLVAALGFIGDSVGLDDLFVRLKSQADPFLPGQVSGIIDQYVTGILSTRSTAFLTVGLVGTVWGAAGGVGTLIKGLNRAYDVPTPRPFWKRQLLAVSVTLTVPPAGCLLLALAVLGRTAVGVVGESLGLGDRLIAIVAWARWPVLVVFLFACFSILYHVLPNVRHRYAWSLPGSAIATGGWLLLTEAFSLYVSNFGKYDSTYGSFGAAIAFLLWLYFIGIVVLLGAKVNALLEPTQRKHWYR